jgi:dienelactone hydrolase
MAYQLSKCHYRRIPADLTWTPIMNFSRAVLRLSCCVLLLSGASVQCARAETAAPLPPAESFFGHAQFGSAALSPDGRLLAVVVGAQGKRDSLAVIDLADNKFYPTAGFDNADIGRIQWVNNKRLLFDTTDKQLGQRDNHFGPGLYAKNDDGSGFKQLAYRTGQQHAADTTAAGIQETLPWNTFMMRQNGAQASDFVYVTSPQYDTKGDVIDVELLRLNTLTGRSYQVDAPPHVMRWVLDQHGEPAMAITTERDEASVYYRAPGGKAWKKITSYNPYTGVGGYSPLAFGPDGTLYVGSGAGKDKQSVFAMDVASGKMNPTPLVDSANYDFDGELIMGRGKLLGLTMWGDSDSTLWFDPAMKAVQAEVDEKLANTANLITVPVRPATPWVLVTAFSDVQPRTLLVYNTETKAFKRIGSAHPAIKAAQMGTQEVVRYKARDGLPIPAWLTIPPGGKRTGLPQVVLVHGGPYVRGGAWGWNAETQFLASRGYAVLEPEYRGSTGFGEAHFRAGWKQWGLGMQDDVADGAKWAIAQGIVDPKRICISGASYGGYAALMGLVNNPELFKCGVSWVGVTDIDLLYNGSWGFDDDISARYRKYGMPVLVGDPVKDAAQFKATSPLQQAARISQPLLLAYGGADRREPLYHGEKLYKAVKQTNPDVEWIVYPDEGHGWALPKNRVERFLDRNIGKP